MLTGIIMSVITCICWGSTSFLMRSIKRLNSIEMLFMRALGGFICAAVIVCFTGGVDFAKLCVSENVLIFAALVLIHNILGDAFLFLSVHRMGVAKSASISCSYPIPVAVVSYLFFDSPLTVEVIAGTLSVIFGVVLLCRKKEAETDFPISGIIFALGASFSWAAGLLINAELVKLGLLPVTIDIGRGITFLTISFFIWFFKEVFFEKRGVCACRGLLVRDSFIAVVTGVFSLGLGTFFYSEALEYISPSIATPLCAANPIISSLLAAFFYNEKLHAIQWIGVACIVAGSVVVTL